MQLHEEIRHLREQVGMTQGELAEGYATASYISIIEKGKAVPSRKVLRKIAEKLGKPAYYFEAHINRGDDALELRTKVEQLKTFASEGKLAEARALADELRADIPTTTDNDLRGRYLMAMGYYSWAANDLDASISYYRQALEHFENLKWHHRCIDALYGLGNINGRRGNMRQALDYLQQAIAIDDNTRAGNPKTMYALRIDYANFLLRVGKPKEAYRLLEPLSLSSSLGYQERVHMMLNLSRASQDVGDYQQAFECAREASRLAQERDDLANRAIAQEMAAQILIEMQEYEAAARVLNDAELLCLSLGKPCERDRVSILKARLALRSGELDRVEPILASLGQELDGLLVANVSMVQADRHRLLGNHVLAIEHYSLAAERFAVDENYGYAIDAWHQAAEVAQAAGNAPVAANLLFRAINAYNRMSRKDGSEVAVSS